MSVLLPPPKRQKVYHGIPEPENTHISQDPVPNVVVQFVNDQDGFPLAPAVNLPANVTKDALESLVNSLRPQVRFSHTSPARSLSTSGSFFTSPRTMILSPFFSILMRRRKR